MKVSVVIPALDEAECIEAAIQSSRAPEVEIAVVDGGSRDDTRARAERAGARIIECAPGRARQLDAGLRATSGPAVVFLHADTQLPPDYHVSVERALGDPRVSGGAFRLAFREPRPRSLRLLEWWVRLRVAVFRLPYGDQAIFARRSALQAIGGVPQVPVMEDLDLVRALARQGRLALLPEIATTSARRYLEHGPLRTALVHGLAACAWALGLDRRRVAAWVRR